MTFREVEKKTSRICIQLGLVLSMSETVWKKIACATDKFLIFLPRFNFSKINYLPATLELYPLEINWSRYQRVQSVRRILTRDLSTGERSWRADWSCTALTGHCHSLSCASSQPSPVEDKALWLVENTRANSSNQSEQTCFFLTNQVRDQNQSWIGFLSFPRLATAARFYCEIWLVPAVFPFVLIGKFSLDFKTVITKPI